MQHHIPIDKLGGHGASMANAVTTCVHCGFCLAACPTYKVLGEEMDSPRGRILLMKQVLEDELAAADALPYVDRCLGCLGCETACPSGVRYRDLLVPFRARMEEEQRSHTAWWRREALLTILESPAAFRVASAVGSVARRMGTLAPRGWRAALDLLPGPLPAPRPLPERTAPAGLRRARIALLAGCVQQVLRPSINAATVRLLAANGVEVLVPRGQGCCGALALHVGFAARGAALAAHNARLFPPDVDAIITTSAGCGSAMKEQPYRAPVYDVSEFLDRLGLHTPLALPMPTTVAYHDACHLSHGQGVRGAPRRLLQHIANLTLVELSNGDTCCGSAGLYNLEHPETAAALGARKAASAQQTGASLIATGNIGCMTQLQRYLGIPVHHTLEVLEMAYSAP